MNSKGKLMTDTLTTAVIPIGVTIAMLIGVYLGSELSNKEAVKTVCAEYNVTTGDFQWIEKYKR